MEFRWNEWIPIILRSTACGRKRPRRSYGAPGGHMRHTEGKRLVRGRGVGGRLIQVIFIIDDDEDETIYVIHARPLTHKEKRQFRRGN